jgi:hypothetical protein
MTAGGLAFLEVGVVAAPEDAVRALGEIEFEHPGHRARKELAVVADEHDSAAQAAHERFETFETVEVEIVGGFVEQNDVEARQEQRGQSDARRLTAGQRGHQRFGHVGVGEFQAEIREHGGDALVEVGGAAREPAVQR